jgi:DNA-binding NtrC family response regulator
MVAEGRFREDLWYRLSTAVVRLPPLRERGADIDILIDSLWQRLTNGSTLLAEKKISAAARRALRAHTWPGNIRELMATLTRIAVQSTGKEVSAAEAQASIELGIRSAGGSSILDRPIVEGKFDINEVLKEVKRHYIHRALEQTAGNKAKAARTLGLGNHATLHDWIRALNMDDE